MKRILLFAIAFTLNMVIVNGQPTCPVNENFDAGNIWTSTGTPGWSINPTYSISTPNSIRGQFNIGGSSSLTSPSFSTTGSTTVSLKFKHICKLNTFDGGFLEADTGTGWFQLKAGLKLFLRCVYIFPLLFCSSFL